ncbi:hypothetical protein, partial [Klebsiella pneumoniae]|uniref:hypothetical protein n=1 Tax=Klebsiella pneumoniae TaxID=573 RepID=UPI00195425B8
KYLVSVTTRIEPVSNQLTPFHLALQDKKIHLASADDGSETIFDDSRGEIICLAFSQDAKYLAGGDVS